MSRFTAAVGIEASLGSILQAKCYRHQASQCFCSPEVFLSPIADVRYAHIAPRLCSCIRPYGRIHNFRIQHKEAVISKLGAFGIIDVDNPVRTELPERKGCCIIPIP